MKAIADMVIEEVTNPMDDKEYDRLKELVESGRKYHYRSFVFAALALVFLTKDLEQNLALFLGIEFPIKYLILFLYFSIIIHTIITIDIFNAVWSPIKNQFDNQIPFNWFILTNKSTTALAVIFLGLPWVICAVSILYSGLNIMSDAIILGGFFSILIPKPNQTVGTPNLK